MTGPEPVRRDGCVCSIGLPSKHTLYIVIKKVQVLKRPVRGQLGREPLRLKLDAYRGFAMKSIPKRTNLR